MEKFTKRYDVAVIGRGILALSTVFCLLKTHKNLNIAVIGKEEFIGSASQAAGAMLNYIGEVTSTTLSNPYSKKKLEISIEAGKKWAEWINLINSLLPTEKHIKIIPGTFVILNSLSGSLDTENYLAIMQAANVYDEPFEEVDPKDIPGLNPLDDCRPLRALYLKNECSISANQMIDALLYILKQNNNIHFINENVHSVNTSDSKIKYLTLENDDVIYANKILLAAGSYSQQLIDKIPEIANKIPRLLSGIGLAAQISQKSFNSIQHTIRTPNRSGACGLHVMPRSEKMLYIGATNNISFRPTIKHKLGLTQFLLQCVIDQIDQSLYSSEIIDWRVGNRPVTVDTFPLIGKTSINNFYILTGTYRDGFHQSPLLGEYMAKIILESEEQIDDPFVPERELIQILPNKEAAVQEVVKHYMAGFYEHNMRLARLFPEKSFEELLYHKFEKIYSMLDTEFPLVADIMFLFELGEDIEQNIKYFNHYFKTYNR